MCIHFFIECTIIPPYYYYSKVAGVRATFTQTVLTSHLSNNSLYATFLYLFSFRCGVVSVNYEKYSKVFATENLFCENVY